MKDLSDEELKNEILWRKVDVMVREVESRYEGQPTEERRKEYEELHAIYQGYWDEAVRRNLVNKVEL